MHSFLVVYQYVFYMADIDVYPLAYIIAMCNLKPLMKMLQFFIKKI